MGKEDLALNRMLERPAIFADLVNGTYYKGKQVVDAKELVPQFTTEQIFYEQKDGTKKGIKRMRDVKMKTRLGTFSVMFATETQNNVHYAMPLRNMLYDAIAYAKQVEDMKKNHADAGEKLRGDEFLSGIKKEDRLSPIMNLVFYLGDDWDGPKSLHDMMGIHGETEEMKALLEYLPDYKLMLVSAETIEDPKWFRSCLQQIFSMLKLKKDKKALYQYVLDHREELKKMDRVEQQATLTLFGEGRWLQDVFEEKEEEKDMPGIFTEMIFEIAEEKAHEMAEGMANERTREFEEKYNLLVQKLVAAKRYDDLEHLTREPEFKTRLFEEFQIV